MTQLAFASNSSRSRANQHVGPRPEHEEHGHDPLVGQLTNKFLAGVGNLSPAVLVGLHRQLGSPSAVRATVEAHRNGQPLPTPASLTSRFAAHRSLGAPAAQHAQEHHGAEHEGHHSFSESAEHFLHKVHAGHEVAHFVEHAAHGAHLVEHAMGALNEGRVLSGALNTVEHAMQAERTLAGGATAKLGQIAVPVLAKAGNTAVGRVAAKGLGVLGSTAAQATMGAASTGLAIYNGYENADATTTAGKLATAAASGLTSYAVTATGLGALDAGLGLVGLEDYQVGKNLGGAVSAISSIGEGIMTGDERGMAKFHERSMRGEHGKFMQCASKVGDFLSDGIVNAICPPRRE